MEAKFHTQTQEHGDTDMLLEIVTSYLDRLKAKVESVNINVNKK